MVLKTSDYVIIVIKWLLTIITIGGNLTTIIIILRKKKLRNRPDTRFMLSLAAADMAVGFFVMVPGIFYIMVSYGVNLFLQKLHDLFRTTVIGGSAYWAVSCGSP